jgi:hypothetical protein
MRMKKQLSTEHTTEHNKARRIRAATKKRPLKVAVEYRVIIESYRSEPIAIDYYQCFGRQARNYYKHVIRI